MIDIRELDYAITTSLKAQGLEGGRYAVVIWGPPGDNAAYVTSNVVHTETVHKMFKNAINIIGNSDGDLIDTDVMGSA